MKATIDIPDVLYREAKTRTASEGTTIDGIFVAFLGGWLESRGWHPEVKTEYVMVCQAKLGRTNRMKGICTAKKTTCR